MSVDWLSYDNIYALIERLESWWHIIWTWAKQTRDGDSAAWAIAFTMNTWAGTLDRARLQLYGAVRKAIADGRAKAEQANFLEQLSEWESKDPKEVARFSEQFNAFLSELARFNAKYPSLSDSENQFLSICWFPRIVLVISAFFSVCCILFQWFTNGTLIVLFPYPLFCCYYIYRIFRIPHYIEGRFDAFLDMIPVIKKRIEINQAKAQKGLNVLKERWTRPMPD